MATPTGPQTHRAHRLIAAGTTCALAAVTAAGFGRVFEGARGTLYLILAGVLSAVLATALERRRLPVASAVSAGALLLLLAFLVVPETLRWGLVPGPGTLTALARAAARVGVQARAQVSPTGISPPLLLACIVAVWTAIWSAHALAFRAGSPLLALLPPLALVAFADVVLRGPATPAHGLAFLAAAILLFLGSNLLAHEQSDGRPGIERAGGRGRTGRARGAWRIGAVTLAVATFAALLPGFGTAGSIDLRTPGNDEGGIQVDPFVSIRASLGRSEPVDVFKVTAERPSYWRLLVLTEFDGATWRQVGDEHGARTVDVPEGAPLPVGPTGPGPATTVSFRSLARIDPPWLPVSTPPLRASLPGRDLRWDPDAETALFEGSLEPGTTWSVSSRILRPTPGQLRSTSEAPPNVADIQLPQDLSPAIARTAHAWTVDATSTYDRVVAVQDAFRDPANGFVYDPGIPERDERFGVERFVEETRRGFCQQFAGAMAVLLRSLGIPARVAVGFGPGEPAAGEPGSWVVTTEDAHAWVEVWFPEYGWLPFEPTPPRASGAAAIFPYTRVRRVQPCRGDDCPGGPGGGGGGGAGSQPSTGPGGRIRPEPPAGDPDLSEPAAISNGGGSGLRPSWPAAGAVAAGMAALVLIGLALSPAARALRRRRRLRASAGDPRSLILATYDVFLERAARLGFGRIDGETVDEHRRRLLAVLGAHGAGGDVERLCGAVTLAAYGAEEPEPELAAAAGVAAGSVIRTMRRARGRRGDRVAQRLRPVAVTV